MRDYMRPVNDDWPLEKWEEEFDYRFSDNVVYWQELAAEIHAGDPDMNGLKRFINSCIDKALAAGGWRRVTDELPPEGGPGDWVFVWTLGAQMHIGFRRAGAWYLPSAAPVESTVTHWRPRFAAPPGQSWRGKK